MTVILEKILDEMNSLNRDDRRQLKAILIQMEDETPRIMGQEPWLQGMAAKGLVTLPVGLLGKAAPVPISGESVSKIIIEDRR